MHVQVVTFRLRGMGEDDYRAFCEQVAPAVAALPGLLTKVWLADTATNTYGGIYLWRDRAALEQFQQTELFRAVATHPHLTDVTARDFPILEGPTQVTRGLVTAAARP
jgi:hypothetical protein